MPKEISCHVVKITSTERANFGTERCELKPAPHPNPRSDLQVSIVVLTILSKALIYQKGPSQHGPGLPAPTNTPTGRESGARKDPQP
jgi:hypothetical protein